MFVCLCACKPLSHTNLQSDDIPDAVAQRHRNTGLQSVLRHSLTVESWPVVTGDAVHRIYFREYNPVHELTFCFPFASLCPPTHTHTTSPLPFLFRRYGGVTLIRRYSPQPYAALPPCFLILPPLLAVTRFSVSHVTDGRQLRVLQRAFASAVWLCRDPTRPPASTPIGPAGLPPT